MPVVPPSPYSVQLRKAVHVFSAGHFITLNDTLCEPIHGHNWTVGIDVDGPLNAHGMVVDFIALRDAAADVLHSLDHHMLLPTTNPLLTVTLATGPGGHEEVTVQFQSRRWIFPADECVLLPVVNTTAELLADWIGQQLKSRMTAAGTPLIGRLRIEVDECLGQSGCWELT